MNKKIIFLVLSAVFLLSGCAMKNNDFRESRNQQSGIEPKTKPYYESFRRKCEQATSPECCLSSINNAELHNSLIFKEASLDNVLCPDGFIPDMLKCKDSYMFCSPTDKNLNTNKQSAELQESFCETDEDCLLSKNHPKRTGVCVNKDWQAAWDRNPESNKYINDCMMGYVCTGLEFVAGGMKRPKSNCQCVSNFCRLVDLTDYPGCRMAGCGDW